jgi:hypothetical protein
MIGVSRQRLSKVLDNLVERKEIELAYRKITVTQEMVRRNLETR